MGEDLSRAVREAYDEIAEEYDDHRTSDDTDVPVLEAFIERLGPDAHVLDAGCGAGVPVTTALAEHATVTGLDFSRAQLSLAGNRLPGTAFVRGDMARLPFERDTFDGLVAFYSVIHVPKERHATLFEEFHRVCRSGAPVVLTVGHTDWVGRNDDWMGMGAEMRWDIPGIERTKRLMRASGFTVEGTETVADTVAEDADAAKPFVWAHA
ncbi:class I SAM-dependent methyltransferase [Halapricum hydrolyticum]|uniref:Class I SAM-dependent methyltransferase n=1 Tax=Halapricum hydrolyticum TaxID=2979991 RepID=A0AAE3LG85_9EURY|nr:methyltransferase domain-containing protein [Halapricum hydrolyticum]MCU4719363.1 class I SAM-dependent methyltransferase [Halapricum hydrolyticum]MCU4728372.1 class I SAM-dependent methyltransferase [Halapricum hydrolyticum]